MSLEQWSAVDRYITDQLVPADPALDAALADSAAAGLPSINVSPTQGKLLHLLARAEALAQSSKSVRSLATAPSGWRVHYVRAGV